MATAIGILGVLVLAVAPSAGSLTVPPPPALPGGRYVELPPPPDVPVLARADAPRVTARASAAVETELEGRYPVFGIVLDAGVPDGAGLSLMARPWRALRFHAGAATNLVSAGVHGGLSLVPFDTLLAPVLMVDAGRFFEGDLDRLATHFDLPAETNGYGRIGYDYATASLGFELGVPRRFALFARVGVSYVKARLSSQPVSLQNDGQQMTLEAGEVEFRVLMPAAKIGLLFYLG